eukprot:TRINITY_DN47318_c0_g1_i1.p1 TRINITY_DN47318_c0_g1~~TRINITY_DN47318_c0_g1_i1.p1  ORF type:complete len:221 (-),score=36.75 TRINITY_DN47318_c0_g1_i1:717-1379(-)
MPDMPLKRADQAQRMPSTAARATRASRARDVSDVRQALRRRGDEVLYEMRYERRRAQADKSAHVALNAQARIGQKFDKKNEDDAPSVRCLPSWLESRAAVDTTPAFPTKKLTEEVAQGGSRKLPPNAQGVQMQTSSGFAKFPSYSHRDELKFYNKLSSSGRSLAGPPPGLTRGDLQAQAAKFSGTQPMKVNMNVEGGVYFDLLAELQNLNLKNGMPAFIR